MLIDFTIHMLIIHLIIFQLIVGYQTGSLADVLSKILYYQKTGTYSGTSTTAAYDFIF